MIGRKKNRHRDRKVWHICRFRERYELADDVYYDRRSPLLYTKDFIGSGNDDESCAYWRQLMALRSKSNWLELRGAFAELKNVAGNMSNTFRGYLLNSKFEPAPVKEIGRWLVINEKQAEHIIRELEDVGLLEQVDLPEFDTDHDKPAKNKAKEQRQKRTSTTKREKTTAENPRQRDAGTRNSAERTKINRNRTKPAETSRNRTKPFKKKIKAKIKVKEKTKVKSNINEQFDNGNNNTERNNNRQKSGKVNSNALEGKRKRKTKSTTTDCRQAAVAPTTTPPIMPQASDAGRSRVIQFPKASPRSVRHNQPQSLGEIIKGMEHRYDVDAKDFGAEIYQALAIPHSPDSPQGHRELGCFAALWMKAKSRGISAPVLDELRARVIREARNIGKRRSKCRNPSAVWCKIFKRLLASKVSKQCKVM